MSETNSTAKNLCQIYKKQYDALVNTYCQAKQIFPFGNYPKLTAAIWRVGVLGELWRRVAIMNAETRYWRE